MSLINDALKRAKEGENKEQAPTQGSEKVQAPRESAMRPVETKEQPKSQTIYILSAALVFVLVGVVVLIWMWNGSRQSSGTAVPVATVPAAKGVVAATPATRPTEIQPTAKVPEVETIAPSAVVPASTVAEPEKSAPVNAAVQTVNPVIAKEEPALPPDPVAPAAPAVPQFPTLKLQGIFYNPTKPSTVINGKTYLTGATVAGARIVKIEVDKVTVEWNGDTRILETAQ